MPIAANFESFDHDPINLANHGRTRLSRIR